MSWQSILAILCMLAALLAITISKLAKNREDRSFTRIIAAGFGAATALFLVLGSLTIVGTRQFAILTSFGRPTGTSLHNGLHFKLPWTVAHEMDGAIQIDQYKGEHQILIRLGNSSTARADASIRWQLHQEATPELFMQYKTFDNVRVNLVERNLAVALNEVFASFDPLAPQNLDHSPLPDLAVKATEILRNEVGDKVEIFDVNVPTITYDQGTEDKINQLNQQRAQTSIAKAERTAEAQNKANRAIADSISNDPNVIVNGCINAAIAKGISPFGCWPGQSGTPLVQVPAK